ncbi:MAG TPA: hypothetical protein VF198_10365 [Vicinamibacterales bacterium]
MLALAHAAVLISALAVLSSDVWYSFESFPASQVIAVREADLVVTGTAGGLVSENGQSGRELLVDEVLKGTADRRLVVTGDVPGGTGVFLLARDNTGRLRALSSRDRRMTPLEEVEHIRELVAMFARLKPDTEHPVDGDDRFGLASVGAAFATPVVRCHGADWLGDEVTRMLQWQWEELPALWHAKGAWPIRVRHGVAGNGMLDVENGTPEPRVEAIVRDAFRTGRRPSVALQLPVQLRCELDTRLPARAGELTADDAVRFVRDRLGAKDPSVVVAALDALRQMHDVDSLPSIERLLRHRNAWVVSRAADLIVRLKHRASLPALIDALAAYGASRPRRDDFAAANTLVCAVERLGGSTQALPQLRQLARRGVRQAIVAVGHSSMDPADIELLRAAPGGSHGWLTLVDRSNRPAEEWMARPASFPRWNTWWAVHGSAIRIIDPPRPIPGPCPVAPTRY